MDGIRLQFRYDRWVGPLLGLLGLGRRRSCLVLSNEEIRIRMGWAFTVDIPRTRIASMAATERRVFGWGVHGWRRHWLVNGSSQGLVTITLDRPTRARVCLVPVRLTAVTVSLVNPDVLLSQQV
ncbi:MAG TPA: hypothetical protein VIS05_06600 [Ilumatobacter sp.]